jgi:hypothetical protein
MGRGHASECGTPVPRGTVSRCGRRDTQPHAMPTHVAPSRYVGTRPDENSPTICGFRQGGRWPPDHRFAPTSRCTLHLRSVCSCPRQGFRSVNRRNVPRGTLDRTPLGPRRHVGCDGALARSSIEGILSLHRDNRSTWNSAACRRRPAGQAPPTHRLGRLRAAPPDPSVERR